MPTLEELNAQIEELTRQAEEIKAQDRGNVIAELREKVALYGITARELRLDIPSEPYRERRRAGMGGEKPVPKYTDGQGNYWAGGRGRKPAWVQEIINNGGNIEDYRIVD